MADASLSSTTGYAGQEELMFASDHWEIKLNRVLKDGWAYDNMEPPDDTRGDTRDREGLKERLG